MPEGRVRDPGRPARSRGCAGPPRPVRLGGGFPARPGCSERRRAARGRSALSNLGARRAGGQLCPTADGGGRDGAARCCPGRRCPLGPGAQGGGRRPHYLLQQRPQAQLVRAAALRPLAHIGRRHQPLAAALVLRVHGRGAPGAAAAPPPRRAGLCEPGTSRREGAGGGGAAHAAPWCSGAPPRRHTQQAVSAPRGRPRPAPSGPARPLGGAGLGRPRCRCGAAGERGRAWACHRPRPAVSGSSPEPSPLGWEEPVGGLVFPALLSLTLGC